MSMWTYDQLRLETYKGLNPQLDIETVRLGPFLALKYAQVGYFNRVIGPAVHLNAHWEALFDHYQSGRLPFRLSLTGGGYAALIKTRMAGFVDTDPEDYWIRSTEHPEMKTPADWEVEPLSRRDRRLFFSTYLDCFAGPGCDRETALSHMVHLFDMAGLHCQWALYKGARAGIGMWHCQDSIASFCAGAILPQFRQHGGHLALLCHRLAEAGKHGCQQAVAVVKSGSRSGRNLEKAGFRMLWRDRASQWPGAGNCATIAS